MKRKLIALFLAVILPLTMLPAVESAQAVGSDISDSISVVTDAIDNLSDLMEPGEASLISTIFSDFASAYSAVGAITGPINGAVSFLQLIGVMKNGTSEALANISRQLTAISEKMSQMDTKLDMITEQMQMMQATEEFNARAIKASQMLSGWHSFEANYMEDKMDELMRQYNVMLMDGLKSWVEDKTADARTGGVVKTDRVILWYKCTNAPDPDDITPGELEYELQLTDANQFSWEKRSEQISPDPYTIYSDEFDSKYDQYIILDDAFFPQKGEMSWNVNTYRDSIKNYIKNKITEYIKKGDYSHFSTWNFYEYSEYGDPSKRTPELIEKTADEAVNQLMFRICSGKVNESADFPSKVSMYFKEYCNHLSSSQQGIDAMLKTLYLTNAFEFETKDDINNFLDSMALKTGVYGVFAMNVAGLSRSTSDSDRKALLDQMCSALDSIGEAKKNGLTGNDAYCYPTNSVIEYAQLTFTGSADSLWRNRGDYTAYRSCSGGSINTRMTRADGSTVQGSLIGDSNAVLLTYVLNATGEKLDHDFMNEHLTKDHLKDYGALVTSVVGETQMTEDADISLKTENVIGDYFRGGPIIRLNSLPDSAEYGYVEIRRMMTGTLYDPKAVKLTVSKPLAGIAVYGENHTFWLCDESAVMGGPSNMGSFTRSATDERTDSDVLGNTYYTTHFNMSVTYNCLVNVPLTKAAGSGEYDPLGDLNEFLDSEIKVKDSAHVHEWDEGTVTQEPADGEPGVITYTCKTDPSHTRTAAYPTKEVVTLTFDPNGGVFRGHTDPVLLEFEKGSKILLPEGAEKEGEEFLYWSSDEYPADAEYTVGSPQTFTAAWKISEEEEEPAAVADQNNGGMLGDVLDSSIADPEPDYTFVWVWIIIGAAAAVVITLLVRRHMKRKTGGNVKI